MSRLWTSGFEVAVDASGTGDNTDVDGRGLISGGSPLSRVASNQRSGNAALRVATTGGFSFGYVQFSFISALDRWLYARVYLRISTPPPPPNAQILQFVVSAGSAPSVLLNSDSTVSPVQNQPLKSSALNDGNYHRIEYGAKSSTTQASRAWELRVDGTTVGSGTGQTDSSVSFSGLNIGGIDLVDLDCLFDDVALNDDQGASQNSWPGDGKVVLLRPTADSAVGTGWTLGTGTAISGNSGKTAVSNTPPLGVADLAAGSDVKQIRNATSNANVNYDATMTTYTAAGVGASDTIKAVQPWVATAAPLVTSPKAGTVGVVSNPAIANVALAAHGAAGAFWSGAAGGAYPTGWKWSGGTTAYAPSVTLGTAPVMRITQVTASTRIAVVCGMFIYVDYTPAAVAAAAAIPDVGMALTVT